MSAQARSEFMEIAVIDGNRERCAQIVGGLQGSYTVVPYANASLALDEMRVRPPRLVLVDETAPPIGGFDLVGRMRQNRALCLVPAILILANDKDGIVATVQQCGGTSHLIRPFRRSALLKEISTIINQKVEQAWDNLLPVQQNVLKKSLTVIHSVSDALEDGTPIATEALSEACSSLVGAVSQKDFKSVLKGLRNHDNYTYVHSVRVATYLTLLGNTIGLKQTDLELLAGCGLLHDVGKMTIPHDILNKAGKLAPTEWDVMRGHAEASVRCLQTTGSIHRVIIAVAGEHHETLDGSGYPRGLSGRAINELTRMATIADIFGALTDVRIYKPSMRAERALAIMSSEMKTKIDQHLLATFGTVLLDLGQAEEEGE